MRSLFTYIFVALTFAAVARAQIVLDPSPARVDGHPSVSPAEQLLVTNLNPNFGVNGGLYFPEGAAVDTSGSPPIFYVADTGNNRVLAWKNATSLTNLQAPDLIIGQPNSYTTLPAINGGLSYPTGVVVDAKGNLYVADSGNNRILRFPTPFANSTTVSGSASPVDTKVDIVLGQPDMFTSKSANQGGSVSALTLYLSSSHTYVAPLAIDAAGNLWVCDAGNGRVLQYSAGSLTTGAADPAATLVIGQPGFTVVNAPASVTDRSTLATPGGLAFDSAGNLFVSDSAANRLMVFTPPFSNGMAASRLAGIVTPTPATATQSTLKSPGGIVMIGNGPAVVDTGDNRLLLFDPYSSPDWAVTSGDTTVSQPPLKATAVLGQGASLTAFTTSSANAGNPQASFSNNGTQIPTFSGPAAAAVAGTDLFLVDSGNNRVLVYPSAGQTATASAVLGQSAFPYNSPNSIRGEEFYFGPSALGAYDAGIVVDSSTSTPHLYISDPNNHRVLGFSDARKVGPGVAADLVIGEPDLKTAVCNFGGITNPSTETNAPPRQPTQASLCYPTGLAVDPATGNLFVADSGNGRVLRFPAPFAPNATLQADLVLGQTGFTGISNPQASQTIMEIPYGLVFDPQRGLLVSDEGANRILLFPMTNPTNGEPASTVIGQPNFVGTSSTVLSAPHHIAEDTIAEVYVADTAHNQVLVFNIPSGTSSTTPVSAYTGLSGPEAVWVNQSTVAGYHNDIWVGDLTGLSRFPVPNPLGTNTATLTMPAAEVAGPSLTCSGGSLCEYPAIAVTQDSFGALYVADYTNRVAIHYPALAGTNGASFACAMGCSLGGQTDTLYYLSPGAYASLFPFSTSFPVTATANTTLPVPTTLGGVQVQVNGVASPVTYVSPSQINFVVPFEAPTSGTAELAVVNPSTSQVVGSGSVTMNVAAPGFFITTQTTAGATPAAGQIAALNCNLVNKQCDNTVNSTAHPAGAGSTIQLYLTGQGQVSGAPPDGQAAPCSGSTVQTGAKPEVLIGATIASVTYSGLAPCYVGLWQINAVIPASASLSPVPGFPDGVYPVLVDFQGLVSDPSSNIHVPSLAQTIVISGGP